MRFTHAYMHFFPTEIIFDFVLNAVFFAIAATVVIAAAIFIDWQGRRAWILPLPLCLSACLYVHVQYLLFPL